MATSGTTSFSVTELDIITDALENLGVYGAGETISADDIVTVRRKLNMLMKQWTAQIDFAPGLKMWTRRTGWLFMQKNQVAYSLGPTGDEVAAETYYGTTLAASASLGAGTITVTTVTGIATTMRIGILLDSGSMQWTTVNGAPAGSVVTLTATLTGAAAAGNAVYVYASKIHRPFEIVTAVRRDSAGNDTPMDPNLSIDEYELIAAKSQTSSPSALYFEAKRTNATAYLNCAPERLTEVIRLRYLSYVEDLTATTQDVDFPAEWFRALSSQLAMDCAPVFEKEVKPELKLMRDESVRIAQRAYPEKSVAFFECEPDGY